MKGQSNMNTQRKPFQPRRKLGLSNPVLHREDIKLLMPQMAEGDLHFVEQARLLARNNRADSTVKGNVLQWQAERAIRNRA
jgi:hypothetical protein